MIQQLESFEETIALSYQKPVLIFKHSAICPISERAKASIESFLHKNHSTAIFHITVQSDRNLSNEITKRFKVKHETPQLLILRNGRVDRFINHSQISLSTLKDIQIDYVD